MAAWAGERAPGARLSPRGAQVLWLVLGGGLLLRVILAFTTTGDLFDLGSETLVNTALHHDLLHVYRAVNGAASTGDGVPRWPYLPGAFPLILAEHWAAFHLGLDVNSVARLPAALADLGIAWLVQHHLGLRGGKERTRLAAAGLVAFGPAFLAISSVHGQIDAIAILPAVAAVVWWERASASPSRALVCGLLIGAGASVKTVPILLVIALLPGARDRREATTLLGSAAAIPVLLLLPFLAADHAAPLRALRYKGAPGFGGISLLAQPNLADGWLSGKLFTGKIVYSSVTRTLGSMAPLVTLATLAPVAWVAVRRRLPAEVAASMVVLALWVGGVNFFLAYLVWGLPFLLMAGWVRQVAVLQLVWLVPLAIRYHAAFGIGGIAPRWLALGIFFPLMSALWGLALFVLVRMLRRPPRAAAAN